MSKLKEFTEAELKRINDGICKVLLRQWGEEAGFDCYRLVSIQNKIPIETHVKYVVGFTLLTKEHVDALRAGGVEVTIE